MAHKRSGTPAFLIPTRLLAEVLEPLIESLNNKVGVENENGEKQGAIAVIAGRAARTLGDVGEEAIPRRLYAIRQCVQRGTNTEIADALLLALDVYLHETDLPTLPGTRKGALEMVEVWASEYAELEQKQLAETLYRFSQGFLDGLTYDLDDLAPLEEPAASVEELELVA